eukprot:gene2256-2974_t
MPGVCKCLPGYFGIDCSQFIGNDDKPHLLDHEWRGHRPSPRIYVYELPPEMNAWFDMRRLDRPVEHFFLERLLSSHHRTVDPAQADLFLVPLSTRLTDFQSRKPMDLPKIMENPIFLSFWGLTAAVAYKVGLTTNVGWGDMLKSALKHSPFYPNALSDTFEQIKGEGRSVRAVGQIKGEGSGALLHEGASGALMHEGASGALMHEGASGALMHEGASEALLHEGASEALLHEGASGRCAAQLREALAQSCVQDDVSQPLEEILPYDKFSVRVPEKDIPNLPRILKAIPAECTADSGDRCIPKMQQELACALRSMLWSSIFGSAYGEGGDYDAFVMTMLALQDKVVEYRAIGGEAVNDMGQAGDQQARADLQYVLPSPRYGMPWAADTNLPVPV